MSAPHPDHPAGYPRRVLLAVSGLSPQIVTETLYALAVAPEPAQRFVPTEVHVLTTARGARDVKLALLSEQPGGFHRLRADYRLPPIAFEPSHIHLMSDAQGRPLEDIRTLEDNLHCADMLSEAVRRFTADPDCALHVSIAGGRKTMGFYLGYALSLYGRAQDRLSHVLVSEPFESSWEFFYPTPESRVIKTRDGQLADAADARVLLAEIPFVSLRHGLPGALLAGQASFRGTVEAARAAVGPAELVLDLPGRRIRVAGRVLALPPAELALLAVYARRALAGEPPLAPPDKNVPDPDWATRYLAELRQIVGPMGDLDGTERALRLGMDGEYHAQKLSKLRRELRRSLDVAAQPYLIDDGGARPRRYRLALPPEAVRFEPVADADGGDRKLAAAPAAPRRRHTAAQNPPPPPAAPNDAPQEEFSVNRFTRADAAAGARPRGAGEAADA